jgi:hypothetical protein
MVGGLAATAALTPSVDLSAFDQMTGDRVSIEPVINPRGNIGRKCQAKFCQR